MKRRVIYAGLLIGTLAAMPLYVNVGRALAALLSNTTAPFMQTVANPCNGEGVDVSGQMHIVTAETLNGNSMHLEEHISAQAVGIGTTGTRYMLHAANELSANVTLDPSTQTGEVTQVLTEPLISAGAAPNFVLHVQSHLTVSATGSITATVNRVSAACR